MSEWKTPTEDDFIELSLDEEARGARETGELRSLEARFGALHTLHRSRGINGVALTTLDELCPLLGYTLRSSVLEDLVNLTSTDWWDARVKLPDGAVELRCHDISGGLGPIPLL